MTLKPETEKFLHWVQAWFTERGYSVQEGLPWRAYRWNTPTLVHCLDDRGESVFGQLLHFVNVADLTKRLGALMASKPCPGGIFVFVPANAPFDVEIDLEGEYTYEIEIVQSPNYDGYAQKHYDNEWRKSGFSVRVRKRECDSKE